MKGSNPPVTLSPELVDKILENIPSKEVRRTLVSCALVATWWTGPSQRRLLSSVSIAGGSYQRWMDSVVHSGSKTRLLDYVHSLWQSGVADGRPLRMRDLPRDCGEYFSALRNLQTLMFFKIKVEYIDEEGFGTCFSAFRETLTYLYLNDFVTSFSTFVALVDYFPNLRTLELRTFIGEPDERPVPPLSRPLRGTLQLHYALADLLDLLDQFTKLDLEYERLVVKSTFFTPSELFLDTALQMCMDTVMFLTLAFQLQSTPTISGYRQLRELDVVVLWPSSYHLALISSITSTKLQKITLRTNCSALTETFVQQMEGWDLVDEQLCMLVDRLRAAGYRNTLEVVLQPVDSGDDSEECDFTKILPEFREMGIVTVMDVVSDSLILL